MYVDCKFCLKEDTSLSFLVIISCSSVPFSPRVDSVILKVLDPQVKQV